MSISNKQAFLVSFAVPVLTLFVFPLLGGVLGFLAVLQLIFICSASYLLGAFLIEKTGSTFGFSTFAKSYLSIYLGGQLLSLLVFLPVPAALFYVLLAIVVIFLSVWFFRSGIFKRAAINAGDVLVLLLAIAIAMILSIEAGDVIRSLLDVPRRLSNQPFIDPEFFTTITTSIKKGGLYSAAYEVGTPINYQPFAFLFPAFILKYVSVTPNVALWGIAMPFYKILGFLLIPEFFKTFVPEKHHSKLWLGAVSILLVVLLTPLHPLKLVHLDYKNFIWLGIGYLMPGGNVPFTAAFIPVLLCLCCFFSRHWEESKLIRNLFVLFLVLVLCSKIAMFVVLIIAVGFVSLLNFLFKKKPSYIIYTAVGFALAVLLYKFVINAGPKTSELLIKPGYFYHDYLQPLLNMQLSSMKDYVKYTAIAFALILVFGSIRFVAMGLTWSKKNTWGLKAFTWGILASVLFSIIFVNTVRIQYIFPLQHLVHDGSYDNIQFLRAVFYLVSIGGALAIVSLLTNDQIKAGYRKTIAVCATGWCLLSLAAVLATNTRKPGVISDPWYDEVSVAVKKIQTTRYFAMDPYSNYEGNMLSGSDVGTFWCAMGRAPEGGYNASNKNAYRWIIFNQVLKADASSKGALQKMKNENVGFIIATPATYDRLLSLANNNPNLLRQSDTNKWILEVL